jgi:hypothetical protein
LRLETSVKAYGQDKKVDFPTDFFDPNKETVAPGSYY